ncbi:MAG TPA: transposase [Candidatus Sulfopaludibacter sp.]|jgi:transposase|nr:transposase [Candidatus Sulfopaludibacter sp.]
MSTLPASPAEPAFAAFAAIDWASKEHVVASVPAIGGRVEIGKLKNTPEAIELWSTSVRQRFPDGPTAVAIEQKRGGVIYMLSKYDHLILYPVPPTMSAFYRHAFVSSGAKDDNGDTLLLLDLLQRHRDRLVPLKQDTPETRLLRFLTEQRRGLVEQKVSVVQQLDDCIAQYFPQLRTWFGALDTPLSEDLLERWPSLQDLQRSHPGTVKRFLAGHRSWDNDRIAEQIRQIYAAIPATPDVVVLEACSRKTAACLAQLHVLGDHVASHNKRIAAVTADHPDAPIFSSLPGAGAALVPRLIAAFGTDRKQWRDAADVQRFSGIAPILIRSGNSSRVIMRRACPIFVRQTFHEFASHSIRFCPWAKLHYEHHLKGDKRNHHRAVRALAFQWIRIIFRCWVNHEPYDERIFLATQRRRNSPFAGKTAAEAGIGFQTKAGFSKLTARS